MQAICPHTLNQINSREIYGLWNTTSLLRSSAKNVSQSEFMGAGGCSFGWVYRTGGVVHFLCSHFHLLYCSPSQSSPLFTFKVRGYFWLGTAKAGTSSRRSFSQEQHSLVIPEVRMLFSAPTLILCMRESHTWMKTGVLEPLLCLCVSWSSVVNHFSLFPVRSDTQKTWDWFTLPVFYCC